MIATKVDEILKKDNIRLSEYFNFWKKYFKLIYYCKIKKSKKKPFRFSFNSPVSLSEK